MELQALAIAAAPIFVGEKLKLYQEAGDQSQKTWEQTPEDDKILLIQQILYVMTHPAYDPAATHATLVRQKLAAGWAVADTYSKEKKTDPELVEYSRLPQLRRDSDALFVAVVKRYTPKPNDSSPQNES